MVSSTGLQYSVQRGPQLPPATVAQAPAHPRIPAALQRSAAAASTTAVGGGGGRGGANARPRPHRFHRGTGTGTGTGNGLGIGIGIGTQRVDKRAAGIDPTTSCESPPLPPSPLTRAFVSLTLPVTVVPTCAHVPAWALFLLLLLLLLTAVA